jgi:hypothetical protein
MYSNPTAAQSVQYVRDTLKSTVAPELQSDKAKVVLAMIDTVLASVAKRVVVEQQWMADECNRMQALLATAARRCDGLSGPAAEAVRKSVASAPKTGPYAPLPSFEELNTTYADLSRLATECIGHLHDLAGEGAPVADELIAELREYFSLRLARDMAGVFAMEGGLLGKG